MSAGAEEQRELVTDYTQLREGIVIVVTPCAWCSAREHRGMLFKRHELSPTMQALAGATGACLSCWQTEPSEHRGLGICACTVREGRVFRVVDGVENPATYAAEIADDERRARQRVSAGLSPVYVWENGR